MLTDARAMTSWWIDIPGQLLAAVGTTSTVVLAAFGSITARNLLVLVSEVAAPPLRVLRGLFTLALIGLTLIYGLLVQPRLSLAPTALVLAGGIVLAVLLITFYRLSRGSARSRRMRPAGRAALTLGKLLLFLGLVVVALLTLISAGYLELWSDRPILLVQLTGRTRPEPIAWSPPNQPARTARLPAHQVLFRTPSGERISEAWIYGDEVAVKARVLRLSPWLNVMGLPNLFELQFAHNGYSTASRHESMPPQAVELPPLGPLAVPPWWRSLRQRLLETFQARQPESAWVQASTIESTYFPLVDANGDPIRAVYRLVLTPGGLSSS